MERDYGTRLGGNGEPDVRLPVAVLGATGVVGQRLVQQLDGHPWFRLAEVVASAGRAGHPYESVQWTLGGSPPPGTADLKLRAPGEPLQSPIVLSSLPSSAAHETEIVLASEGRVVCTNASAHRMRSDTPLIVPEVNPGAIETVFGQRWHERGGALVANPNCVVVGLAMACAPIAREFGIETATIVTLQAISGAGLSGLGAMAVAGNVIPAIKGEEEKIGPELNKVLGAEIEVAVAVNRVPVLDGHTAHVFLKLGRTASAKDIAALLEDFRPPPAARELPSLPARPLVVRTESDRPQPRLDANAAAGMAVTIGRIRAAPPPHDLAFVVVAHNGVRGAAGACLANAELYMTSESSASRGPP